MMLAFKEYWQKNLDETHDIDVLDLDTTFSQWRELAVSSVKDPLDLPEGVPVRLFLVEGLSWRTLTYLSFVDHRFFRGHCANIVHYGQDTAGGMCFWAKWFQP